MNNKPWILRFALCVGFLFGAAACTDDQLVRGPQAACTGDACQNDVGTTDSSGDADVQWTRSVNFLSASKVRSPRPSVAASAR